MKICLKITAILMIVCVCAFAACGSDSGGGDSGAGVSFINNVVITGFVTPITGKAAQALGALTTGAATYTVTSLTWSPTTTPYAALTAYTATVVLTSYAGNKFTALTPAINTGTPSAGTVGGGDVSGNTLTFTVSFPATLPATGMVLGDARGGGIIADILVSGDPGYDAAVQHGFIAASADQSTGIIWAIGTYQTSWVPDGTGQMLGYGSANTDAIIAQNGAGITYAAGLARAYNGGGYTDWYLPSKDELNKLYLNRAVIGGFAANYYWCSSEVNNNFAWAQFFTVGTQATGYKNDAVSVRAVRTF